MEIDKTTINDLSIFHSEEEFSIFNRLNFTQTIEGRDCLYKFFQQPNNSLDKIREIQNTVKLLGTYLDQWPSIISNGTIMVIEKFYETPIDSIPTSGGPINGLTYKLFHNPDYSIVRYSISHFSDLIKGYQIFLNLFENKTLPDSLNKAIQRAKLLIDNPVLLELSQIHSTQKLTPAQVIKFGYFLRYKYKLQSQELISLYGQLDAWHSMAKAVNHFHLVFPDFVESINPVFDAEGLYHILLPNPTSYTIKLEKNNNFLFLTGANMAGKSTFIKSVGAAVYLAHLGLGVPAQSMTLTVFDGILSNINVMDNIVKGESYFFNEVQRIKTTILKINDGRKWLVLIDELFKGTNVQDAMKCSLTVIKGLIKIPNSLFILSTHLYEIGQELQSFPNIQFRYFETAVLEDQLEFSYQLKEGISNDRLGYLILKKEKVVDLLEKL